MGRVPTKADQSSRLPASSQARKAAGLRREDVIDAAALDGGGKGELADVGVEEAFGVFAMGDGVGGWMAEVAEELFALGLRHGLLGTRVRAR